MSDLNEKGDAVPLSPDEMLAPYFAAAQGAQTDDLSENLFARVLADAAAEQPKPAPQARPMGLVGWLAEIRDGLGGWSALAGISTAMVAGLWIGGTDPSWSTSLPLIGTEAAQSDSLTDDDLELLFPSYDSLLEGA